MLIGYARVSLRLKQDPAAQLAALERAGCERVFQDRVSRVQDARPGLEDALSHMREGDVLVVWRLDRVVSGMRQALTLLERLRKSGACIVSLTEGIDTRTPLGEALFTIVSAFSQLEVQANHERTAERLAYLKSKGAKLGRKAILTPEQVRAADELLRADPDRYVGDVARMFGVSKATLNRARARLRAQEAQTPPAGGE